jgi:hypothetical protein
MKPALAAIGRQGARRMFAITRGVPMHAHGFKFGTYRHYRGDLYTAIGLVTHHHTRQPMVLYVSHAKGCVNCRPLFAQAGDPDGFYGAVVVNGHSVPRFELVEEAKP